MEDIQYHLKDNLTSYLAALILELIVDLSRELCYITFLGVTVSPNLDVFLIKVQTAFDLRIQIFIFILGHIDV